MSGSVGVMEFLFKIFKKTVLPTHKLCIEGCALVMATHGNASNGNYCEKVAAKASTYHSCTQIHGKRAQTEMQRAEKMGRRAEEKCVRA